VILLFVTDVNEYIYIYMYIYVNECIYILIYLSHKQQERCRDVLYCVLCCHNQNADYCRLLTEVSRSDPIALHTQHSLETGIHFPGGIRTRNSKKLVAVDIYLKPLDHWDWRYILIGLIIDAIFIYVKTRTDASKFILFYSYDVLHTAS
jgi:hypothetical protein